MGHEGYRNRVEAEFLSDFQSENLIRLLADLQHAKEAEQASQDKQENETMLASIVGYLSRERKR